jgi:predicted pyridoxine 5'-phosphate oxidase superfamily flavin-nucleotide-binding protein
MSRSYKRIMYTDDVRSAQDRAGHRDVADRMLHGDTGDDAMTQREAAFIRSRDGFYLATVNADGWPYIQYRGGPTGFLRVLDDRTLAFADFRGNRQMLSVGNLAGESRASLFLMDYAQRRRLKILAHSRVADLRDDPELAAQLVDEAYEAHPQRAIVFTVVAHDWNCPQHITPRFTEAEIRRIISEDR